MSVYADRLAQIRAAIDYQLTGNVQSYQIAGRTLAYLDLGKLYEMEKETAFAVARESGQGCAVAQFRNPE